LLIAPTSLETAFEFVKKEGTRKNKYYTHDVKTNTYMIYVCKTFALPLQIRHKDFTGV